MLYNETYYIGRTKEFYMDQDELDERYPVFNPDFWTYSEYECTFEGEHKQLTDAGRELLEQYLDDLSAGYDLCYGRAKGLARRYSREQFYDMIMNDPDYTIDPTDQLSMAI